MTRMTGGDQNEQDDWNDLGDQGGFRFKFVRNDWPAYSHHNENFSFNQN